MDSCRLCYGEISLETCKNIFFSQQNHPPLSDLVAKCADLEVNKDDPYSKNVCVVCYTKLIDFHRFRQVILETNSILHQLSSCINTDNNVKIEKHLEDVSCDNGIKIEIDNDVSIENTVRGSLENSEETQKNEIIDDLLINNNDPASQKNPNDCNKSLKKARKRRSEPKTVCKICGKTYILSYIQHHIRIHSGEQPYECDICGRKFTKKVNLISHRELHDRTRSYKCDHCKHTFSQARNLRKHLRIHTGERPYSCNVCGKTFVWKYCLTVHTRTHNYG